MTDRLKGKTKTNEQTRNVGQHALFTPTVHQVCCLLLHVAHQPHQSQTKNVERTTPPTTEHTHTLAHFLGNSRLCYLLPAHTQPHTQTASKHSGTPFPAPSTRASTP